MALILTPAAQVTADNSADPIKRLRYFYGEFLQEEDFTLEQTYHIAQRQQVTQLLQTPGVVEGMVVTVADVTATGGNLKISAGTAIDGNGSLIVLTSDQVLMVSGDPTTSKTLTIAYAEQATDIAATEPRAATRWNESPSLALTDPSTVDGQSQVTLIPLAKLTFDASGTWDGHPDGSVRLIGGLKAGGLSVSQNAAVTGSLAVSGALTAGGDLSVSQNATVGGTLSVTGLLTASGGLSVSGGPLTLGAAITAFSTDGTLDSNSNANVPTEQAVKSYVDSKIGQIPGPNLSGYAGINGSATEDFNAHNLTCAQLVSGSITPSGSRGATIAGEGGVLALQGYDHAYVEWYTDHANLSARKAYLGFPSAGASDFYIKNETNSDTDEQPVLVISGQSKTFSVFADLSVTGATGAAVVVVPPSEGWIQVGNRETGADDYTSVSMGITSEKKGTPYIQGISAAGSGNYGYLWINPHGQGAIIGHDPDLANDDLLNLDPLKAGSNALFVFGSIGSSVAKQFVIPHPTRAGYSLSHACLEGPEIGVYYRGVARLRSSSATVRLPEYFEVLTRAEGRTVQLTPVGEQPYLLSYTPVVDGVFTVYGDRADGVFSWQVMAVRADVSPLEVEIINDQQHEKE